MVTIAAVGPSVIVGAVAVTAGTVSRTRQEADIVQRGRRVAIARRAIGTVLLLGSTVGVAGTGSVVAVARRLLTVTIRTGARLVAAAALLGPCI